MYSNMRKPAIAALLATGVFLTAAPAAHADAKDRDDHGVGDLGEWSVEADAPVNHCGNAAGVLDSAEADCEKSGAATRGSDEKKDGKDGDDRNSVDVHQPTNVCGNALGVIGDVEAECVNSGAVVHGDDHDGKDEKKGEHEKGKHEKGEHEKGKKEKGKYEEGEYEKKHHDKDEKHHDKDKGHKEEADAQLPVTGVGLTGLTAAAVMTITTGGGAIFLTRRNRSKG